MANKFCKGCDRVLPRTAFYVPKRPKYNNQVSSRCRECLSRQALERYHNDPDYQARQRAARRQYPVPQKYRDPERRKRRMLQYRYGTTPEQIAQMEADQGGVCAICADPPAGYWSSPKGPVPRKLVIDHCHDQGAVRGLLCTNCNSALGLFRDRPDLLERAIAYLARQ